MNVRTRAYTFGSLAKEALFETLWPTRCCVCDLPGAVLCERCERALSRLDRWQACPRCGARTGASSARNVTSERFRRSALNAIRSHRARPPSFWTTLQGESCSPGKTAANAGSLPSWQTPSPARFHLPGARILGKHAHCAPAQGFSPPKRPIALFRQSGTEALGLHRLRTMPPRATRRPLLPDLPNFPATFSPKQHSSSPRPGKRSPVAAGITPKSLPAKSPGCSNFPFGPRSPVRLPATSALWDVERVLAMPSGLSRPNSRRACVPPAVGKSSHGRSLQACSCWTTSSLPAQHSAQQRSR